MKKPNLSAKLFIICAAFLVQNNLFSQPSGKTIITVGTTPLQKDAQEDAKKEFGGAYLLFNGELSSDVMTAGGKIYYRLHSAANRDENAQKLEVKRAYLKIRPFKTEDLELGMGKLYSYYLSGGYFDLNEFYTGSTRWGKTGLGVKAKKSGVIAGIALPLEESYKTVEDHFAINGSLGYDFAPLFDLPLTFGTTLFYEAAGDSDPKEFSKKDLSSSVSLHYSKKNNDSALKKLSAFASYSWNSSCYAANSTFKNIANYSKIGKAKFASVNLKANFDFASFTLEGEAGHSMEGDYVPLYAGTQLLIPVTPHISLRPQFFYYAGLNTKDSDLSRTTYVFYPRLMFYFGKNTISAGAQFERRQTTAEDWNLGWSIPLYWEYKF
ncbi:MAG: hypothetical protein J5817_05105 [Treponema sp.]|nr:hypothetical protein [Treponema sp.]